MDRTERRYLDGLRDAARWISEYATAAEIDGFAQAWRDERPVRVRVRDNHSLTRLVDQDRAPRTRPWETVAIVDPLRGDPWGRGFFAELRAQLPDRFPLVDDEPAAS